MKLIELTDEWPKFKTRREKIKFEYRVASEQKWWELYNNPTPEQAFALWGTWNIEIPIRLINRWTRKW